MKKTLTLAFLCMLLLSSCAFIDAILPNGLKYHTVVKYNYTDTLTIKKDRFTAKILIQNDSLYIWANYMPLSQSNSSNMKAPVASDPLKFKATLPITFIFSKKAARK